MKSTVFFIRSGDQEDINEVAKKTLTLFRAAQFGQIVKDGTLVAVKQHFGERGNTGFLKPPLAKTVGDAVKERGGKPILVETNTLYRGQRANSYDHLMLAHEHGFTIEATGMPVAILDGVAGQNQHAVNIPGKHFQSVFVVPDLPFFDSLFVLTHVKGHLAAAMGGAIKNLAMGFASRAGKLAQHSTFHPEFDAAKCIRCERCGSFCPADAISLQTNGEMGVDTNKCLGCGECYVACQHDAIAFNWGKADSTFQEKMTEHAYGAVIGHPGKVAYLNYFLHISQHCDCWGQENPRRFDDIGIFASNDPVAIDRACYDMAQKIYGRDIFKEFWPQLDVLPQLQHGAEIGLGSQEYDLVEL